MPAKGLTIEQVIANPQTHKELVDTCSKRLRSSSDYFNTRLDTMIRCYKIYRAIKDAADDSDEPNTGPSYAYGIVEDAVAALSESILNARVPTPARARYAQDQKKAENFNSVAATYFSSGPYQEAYPNSVRERIICGANWEADCWAWRYRKGKMWKMVQKVTESGVGYEAMEEVEHEEPVQVGYYTRFPSIFNIRPQPRVASVEKMKWLLEIEENVALEDLQETYYIDPATKERKPFFDLSEIMKEKAGGKSIRPEPVEQQTNNHQAELREIMDGTAEDKDTDDLREDQDQLTLVWVNEPDLIYCVANGRWVIAYIENLYHRPGIKYRVKSCTQQPHSLYGLGMIEPVEGLYYELDDIHILSMRNWVRIINKMVLYNPDAVPYAENDFKPRALGRIRVRPQLGRSVGQEVQAFDHQDVTGSMLAQESNDKGLVERALGLPDFSKGVEGTKQSHSTLGGLNMIAAAAAKRVALIRRQELAGFQKQMFNMQGLYSQFLVEKMPFTTYGPDGSTSMAEFDLWDLDTEGRGMDFIIEYDPAFGDDALMRNQLMVLIDQGIKYNQAVMSMFPPGTKPMVELDEIMRRNFKAFGFNDTSVVLKRPDGVMSPAAELQAMLQGKPVQVNPMEDLISHYLEHLQQAVNPDLVAAIQSGAAPMDVMLRLKTHLEQTRLALEKAIRDPGTMIRMRQFAAENAGGQGQTIQMAASPTRSSPREGVADVSPRTPSPGGRT